MSINRTSVRILTKRVRLLRNAPVDTTTGVRTAPVVVQEDVPSSPIDPVTTDVMQRYMLQTPTDKFVCFIESGQVKLADLIYDYNTQTYYNVAYLASWPESYDEVVLERTRPK